MAKSICSLASPASCASSTLSPSCSSSGSSSSSASSTSSRSTSMSDKSASLKSYSLKSSSTIDRRKRLAANARERKRMHLLNKAYDELRRRLVDAENKSKYDVLVQAKEYIQALATICEKFDQQQQEEQHSQLQQVTPITAGAQHQQQQSQLIQTNIKQLQVSPVDMTYNQIQQTHQQYYHQSDHHHNLASVQHHLKSPMQNVSAGTAKHEFTKYDLHMTTHSEF